MLKINEIFYSIQGEGIWTGTAMIFIRLSGCNLACQFCDTEHKKHNVMTIEAIMDELCKYPANKVCITGGEPTLQNLDELVMRLRDCDYQVHLETNGTCETLDTDLFDWITTSPKSFTQKRLHSCDELKVVYEGQSDNLFVALAKRWKATHKFIQPAFSKKNQDKTYRITVAAIEFVKRNPDWRLSLQTQRMGGFR